PCICVIKILFIFLGLMDVCNIWCCVASPQSNNHILFNSCNKFSATADTFRSLEGTPAPVPRKVNFIYNPLRFFYFHPRLYCVGARRLYLSSSAAALAQYGFLNSARP